MDGISQVASSVEAMNQVLQMATNKTTDLAKRMVAVNVETAVLAGREAGKGAVIDALA